MFDFEKPKIDIAEIPEDKGLDISINLPNYKNAKAILVNVDENSYDLYICVNQTLATKIWRDSDNANNLLRAGNGIVVDYQSESICGYLPNDSKAENIANVYYVDNMSKEFMTMDDADILTDYTPFNSREFIEYEYMLPADFFIQLIK